MSSVIKINSITWLAMAAFVQASIEVYYRDTLTLIYISDGRYKNVNSEAWQASKLEPYHQYAGIVFINCSINLLFEGVSLKKILRTVE
jgi:hypothetical protein